MADNPPMGILSGKAGRLAALAALAGFVLPATSAPVAVPNLTGLPTYPHLDRAVMDDHWRTESPGRWCAMFTGMTTDSLDAVAGWYRSNLQQASETDLTRDGRAYRALSGIKLAVGTDYVVLYRMANQSTIIELHRCGYR